MPGEAHQSYNYTRPPGTENVPWEDFREETGGSQNRADFQTWLVNRQTQNRYDDLSNFQSSYYQLFRSFLEKQTPTFGTDRALAGQVASGSNYATGSVIANEREKAFNRSREDFLNTTVSGFAFQSQGQADTLLGGLLQNSQFQQNLGEQRREFDVSNETDFWDYALSIIPGAASGASGFFGGAGAAAGGSAASVAPVAPALAISDRRLKENIKKTGVSLSGINIYEFNYIGSNTRYRGAMADENLEASVDTDGYKYLDYSKIDVNFEAV